MAAKAQIALHLGAHKTGTSLLQKYLEVRTDEVAKMRVAVITRSQSSDLLGWGEPVRQHPERLRHALIAAGKPRGDRAGKRKLSRAAAALLRRPATVILSNENALGRPFTEGVPGLYPNAADCADALARSVGDLEPRVVYYLRSQEQFLESYYLQTVHQGGTATFADWYSKLDPSAVSWVPVIEAIVNAFGPDRLVLRDFEEIRAGQNAFIEAFLRSCDPRLSPTVDYSALRNISISQRGLDLALAMNPLLESSKERHQVRVFLQRHFNNTTSPRPILLSDIEKDDLRDRFAAENRDLIRRYGGSRD